MRSLGRMMLYEMRVLNEDGCRYEGLENKYISESNNEITRRNERLHVAQQRKIMTLLWKQN